jgi:peptidoglycan/LPS O-acetylase OafA/YrhL
MDKPARGLLGRVAYVDGLRALAALMVLADHAVGHTTLPSAGWTPLAHALREGAHGVDLFFVLSGFCLSYPLLHRLRTAGIAAFELPRYAAKRIVRIVPPYYAALVLFLVAAAALTFAHVPLPAGMNTLPLSGWDVLKQALFLDWHTNFLNASFWTLAVEFRWYFVFPIALLLWIRAPRVFLAIAAGSAILYTFTRLHVPDVGVLLPFLLGIVAADFYARGRKLERGFWLLVPAFIVVGVLAEPFVWMPSPYGVENATFVQTSPAWQIAMFAFVVLAGNIGWLRSVLSVRPLVAIGTASYSIYLVHEPVASFFQEHVLWPGPWRLIGAYGTAVLAGLVFWFLFERIWMYGTVKARSIAMLTPRFASAMRWFGIPPALKFGYGLGALKASPPAEPVQL